MASTTAAALAILLAVTAGAQVTSTQGTPAGEDRFGSPIVEACVDADGQLVSVRIAESSGYPQLDEAALKIARANRYTPASTKAGKKEKHSCVKFKVKFVIKDDEPPATASPAETPAETPTS